MIWSRNWRYAFTGGLLLGAACGEPSGLLNRTGEVTPVVTPASLFGASREQTVDERFAAVAKEAPGFAGVVLASDGALVVQVAGAADEQRAATVFRTVFGRSAAGRAFRTHRVRWSFVELTAARAQVEDAAEGLLISSDIDEAQNRVSFVVRDEAALVRVRQLVTLLGERGSAVTVATGPTPRKMTSLSDGVRPVMGAMMSDIHQTGETCTLSFALLYYGSGTEYVATNSHCTHTLNAVDSPATLRQPTYWAEDYPTLGAVGNEAVDPGLFHGFTMCGGNRACRYSDAALFAVSSTEVVGRIARTTYASSTPGVAGSTTLASTPFAVSGAWTWNDLYVGMTVSKIGRITGWTTGTIEATCVRYYFEYPEVPQTQAYECITVASGTTMRGDSGSPVFTVNGDGTSVMIAGQIFRASHYYYQDPNNSNNDIFEKFLFSSWTNLQTDLGSIYPKT